MHFCTAQPASQNLDRESGPLLREPAYLFRCLERLDTSPFRHEPDISLRQMILGAVSNKHLFKLGRSLDLDGYCGPLLSLQACH